MNETDAALLERVAWRTSAAGIDSIVLTATRARARRVTLSSAKEAGYRVDWCDIRAVRAPELDGAAIPVERPIDPAIARASILEDYEHE